jgi:GDSL-like Lipase/Acylhydrolase family
MRSPERPIAKPNGTYRIALLGDSFTFGWGVQQKESFAQVLEDTLNRASNGHPKFEVLNFGVPGYSTFQEVALFKEKGLQFQPDAVLVYFVQNDFGMPFFIRDISGQGGILSTIKVVQLGKRLLAPGEVDRQMQNVGLDPYRALKDLDDTCRDEGLKCFLTINPRKSEMSDFSKLKRLRDLKIRFLPLRESFMEYVTRHEISDEALTLSYDPHPSPLRHNILGNVLAPFFMEALK